ncbi:hypothetical protein [Psychrobacillus sp. MER TA 171]|uniref:hypothetical protein n=1 Tax=Psychrobacillus sp. MER TA 171 TaxID=2939577 RepID=UPI00203FF617|nr:hypothetical protein [Psychrobacillus sp. MER TA 171]MCM3358184.1 hypothetical protein [Psychrobacillus sp. MER TA 171]
MNNSLIRIVKNNIRAIFAFVAFYIGIFTWLVFSSENVISIEIILLSFFLNGLFSVCLWSMGSNSR